MNGGQQVQFQPVDLAPVREAVDGPAVAGPRIRVADRGGEELDEPPGAQLPGVSEDGGDGWEGAVQSVREGEQCVSHEYPPTGRQTGSPAFRQPGDGRPAKTV